MKKTNIRFLSFVSMSMFVALAPLACGSDDDTTAAGGSSGTTNHAGTSSGGSSNGGKSNSGGSSNVAGDDGVIIGGSDGVAGDNAGGAGGAGATAKARLRVVHASPNAPSVDVYAHGASTAALTALAYGNASDFIEVDAGTLAFDLRAAGAKASTAPAFTTGDVTLESGADYTLVAAGDFAHPADADTGFRLLSFQHDFQTAAAATAVARVVHATSAWATVDLDVVGTDGVDVPGLARFGDVDNVVLPAGAAIDVDFQTVADGVLSKLTLPKLTAGSELFVIATGNPGMPFRAPANGFALLVVDQAGNVGWVKEQPWLHLVHASDIGPVDIYDSAHPAADAKLADDLASAKLANFELPPSQGGSTLKAVAANAATGAATALATGATSTIEAGEHYLAYIAGNVIQTVHEQFDLTQPTKVMLRGVHASADRAQTVDFGAVVSNMLSNVLIDGVAPMESSAEAGVAINAGNVILGVSSHAMTTLLAQKTFTGDAAPVAGERDFVLLVGTDGLWLVNTATPGWSVR